MQNAYSSKSESHADMEDEKLVKMYLEYQLIHRGKIVTTIFLLLNTTHANISNLGLI